jgi:hypothetical protein
MLVQAELACPGTMCQARPSTFRQNAPLQVKDVENRKTGRASLEKIKNVQTVKNTTDHLTPDSTMITLGANQ